MVGGMPESPDHVRDQHLVSRVLLHRWATDGVVSSFNLNHPNSPPKLLTPGGIAYKQDFVRFESRSVEERWQQVENRANYMFATVDAGTLFDRPYYVEDLKDLIALHLARSYATVAMWARAVGSPLGRERLANIAVVLEQPGAVDALFEHFTGFASPGGPEAHSIVVERLGRMLDERFGEGGVTFGQQVVAQFGQLRDWLREKKLQVARAISLNSEFLISDSPAQPLDTENRHVGFLAGVKLNGSANTVILPLGPRVLAAVSNEDEYIDVDAEAVSILNEALVMSARQHVYARPASPIADWVPGAATRRKATLRVRP
jgi:hypothetical protein